MLNSETYQVVFQNRSAELLAGERIGMSKQLARNSQFGSARCVKSYTTCGQLLDQDSIGCSDRITMEGDRDNRSKLYKYDKSFK